MYRGGGEGALATCDHGLSKENPQIEGKPPCEDDSVELERKKSSDDEREKKKVQAAARLLRAAGALLKSPFVLFSSGPKGGYNAPSWPEVQSPIQVHNQRLETVIDNIDPPECFLPHRRRRPRENLSVRPLKDLVGLLNTKNPLHSASATHIAHGRFADP